MRENSVVTSATPVPSRWLALCLLSCLSLLAGCSLPGYDMSAQDSDYWYAPSSAKATWPAGGPPHKIHYDARMVLISPMLISHLEAKRAAQPLDPAVQTLMAEIHPQAYAVGPGDVVQVIVYGHPKLNNPMGNDNGGGVQGQLVSADGTMYFPYVGEIKVAGLTLEQIRRKISRNLTDYIRQPQVDVRVVRFRSKRVFISGDIAKPCTVPLTNITLTVLRALEQCQTLVSPQQKDPFGIQNVALIRDNNVYQLSLNKLYRLGTPIPLQAGDRLIVDDSASRVFMVGEFKQQMALPYSTGGMTLGDAIADAGGINLATADASSIYVIRGFVNSQAVRDTDGDNTITLRPKVFHLDAGAIEALALANKFQLEPRDIIYAAPASMVNINRALALLTPTLDQLFRTFLIYDRVTN